MGNMTYEQFEYWCKYWNMSVDEGHRAMCFVSNIIRQNSSNLIDCANIASNGDNHSDAFKKLIGSLKDDAIHLSILYEKLLSIVYDMLNENDKEVKN